MSLKPWRDARVLITSSGIGMPRELVGTRGTVLEVGRLALVLKMDSFDYAGPLKSHVCMPDRALVLF